MNLRTPTFFALSLFLVAGCRESPKPLTKEEITAAVKDAPEIFNGGDEVGLEGLKGVYLGQPEDEALAAMKAYCERFVTLEGGVMRESSTFKGCQTPDDPLIFSFRVGFTARAENRVFTLEVKRRNLDPKVVRARFAQKFSPLEVDQPRRGALKMESQRFNMFADWDDGSSGPTHILIGLDDDAVAALSNTAPK